MRNGFRRLQAVYGKQHIGEKQKLYFEILPRIQVGLKYRKNTFEYLFFVKNASKGYLARKNAKFRPKAVGILQEKVVQYLAWRDVRSIQIKVK